MKTLVRAAIAVVIGAAALSAASLWRDRNIYSPDANLGPGNVIVINVNDISDMRFRVSTSSKSTSDVSSTPDTNITMFLPKANASRKSSGEDRLEFNGKGNMKFSIAARVVNRVQGGMLSVAGTKTYTFNGERSVMTVSGMVDGSMIRGRSIDARNVVDFALEIRGLKPGITLKRDPLKEDDKASADLTEEEKQQMILNYLQRILGELMR